VEKLRAEWIAGLVLYMRKLRMREVEQFTDSGNMPPSHPSVSYPIPLSFFYKCVPLPIHLPLPPYLPTPPYTGGYSLGRTKGFSSHWCPTRPSSATYAAGAMGPSMCTLWMVV